MNTDRITSLVQKVQSLPDPGGRETALELVQEIMDLHAAGLERIMQLITAAEAGAPILDSIAGDELASSVLLLHDLHPLDIEQRLKRALARDEFHARGASVELVSIDDGVVRIRIEGGPGLKASVEAAALDAAPDAVSIVVEGGREEGGPGFVPLTQLLANTAS